MNRLFIAGVVLWTNPWYIAVIFSLLVILDYIIADSVKKKAKIEARLANR